jgi:cell division transport system permease protein
MKLLKLWRTFKEGASNFYRNGWLSFATVSVLSISLYIISITIILGFAAKLVLVNVQDKINVSVYFNQSVSEETILGIKSKLLESREIKSIDYVTKEKALEEFKKMGGTDSSINQALEEIGENPLLSSLVIKAANPKEYDLIVSSISNSSLNDSIDRINYQENKTAIERLSTIIKLIEQVGLTLGIAFVFIGILITFNAIRLTMYAQKQEFEVKRLVGASNLYIRMPFVFEGIFYGLVSSFSVMILLLITSKIIAPVTKGSIPQGDMLGLYFDHFWTIFGGLLFFGIVLGVASSFIAIKRYLKV